MVKISSTCWSWALALGLWSCGGASEEEVRAEFDAFVRSHSECEEDNDCALVYPGCPLGCYAAVNRAHVSITTRKARELIEDYERGGVSCEYGCPPANAPICEAQRCTEGASSNEVLDAGR